MASSACFISAPSGFGHRNQAPKILCPGFPKDLCIYDTVSHQSEPLAFIKLRISQRNSHKSPARPNRDRTLYFPTQNLEKISETISSRTLLPSISPKRSMAISRSKAARSWVCPISNASSARSTAASASSAAAACLALVSSPFSEVLSPSISNSSSRYRGNSRGIPSSLAEKAKVL